MPLRRENSDGSDDGIRIHYQIPTELHRRLKAEAAYRGLTLKEFLIGTLEKALADGLWERDSTERRIKGSRKASS